MAASFTFFKDWFFGLTRKGLFFNMPEFTASSCGENENLQESDRQIFPREERQPPLFSSSTV